MLTDNVIRVECQNCNAHGELWDEDMERMKPCGACLGVGFSLEDRIHIPSPNHNPDEPMPEGT
jgi:hypothetical protein